MPDTERPASEQRNSRRATAFLAAALLLLVWAILANQWADKGCARPQSYVLVITHQTPDHYEGCDEYGDYTDNYAG